MQRRVGVEEGDCTSTSALSLPSESSRRRVGAFARRLFLRILIVLLLFVLVFTFVLSSFSTLLDQELYPHDGRVSFRDALVDEVSWLRVGSEVRSGESRRVLASVRRDLLNSARQLEAVNAEIESLSKLISDRKSELLVLQQEVESLQLLQVELRDKKNVAVYLPLAPPKRDPSLDERLPNGVTLESAFDFSRCSIAGGFKIFVYDVEKTAPSSNSAKLYFNEFRSLREFTTSADSACVFVVFVEDPKLPWLSSLRYWRNGTNHLLLNFADSPIVERSNAIVVSSSFLKGSYRRGFDVALLLDVPPYDKNYWQSISPVLPYARKYLLTYEASLPLDSLVRSQLSLLSKSAVDSSDEILFHLNCSTVAANEFSLCESVEKRGELLRMSMFVAVFVSASEDSGGQLQRRVIEALRHGAIPVVVSLSAPLPFDDFVDWRRAALRIPFQRLPELHFILRSIAAADVLEMRRRGRFILESYLLNTKVLTSSLASSLRHRIGVPGGSSGLVTATPLFDTSFTAPRLVPSGTPQFEEEYLGPPEAPHKSLSFTHNFTSLQLYSYTLWNDFGVMWGNSPEYLPTDVPFPSDFEFDDGAAFGFRPIAPGSGVEFSSAIGGNRPREQFTVVMLTYQRDAVLFASLERLNNLPYLNKVVVVWNNNEVSWERSWPRIHVPIHFIKAGSNSLNNRFLPYDQIETEAVLSLDDDIDLKQHEIVFAFRVWREQRSKIVGFPARYHARYGDAMYYNSNHTCQHSMILTGAAFIHKSYFYAYSYTMAEVIREKVDEWMNCEDLAMNFLVSHLTRQPPIKTTSKWTLRCPTCAEMLSRDESHFTERHECIRFFTRVYGYNPLLFSQFRVDSVLFKTRLPPNHQKCFKYV